MHPLRQLAAVFQEESTVASTPVAVALASIANRLEALADTLETPARQVEQESEPVKPPVVEEVSEPKSSTPAKKDDKKP
jgi:hypothetical protein